MKALELRPVRAVDVQILHDWRNHPATREMSGSSDPIEFAVHKVWFESFLANPARFMWIGCVGGQPVGSVRLDPDAEQARRFIASIQIDPDQRGKGYGQTILNAVCRKARFDLQATGLIAHIRPENLASQRIFALAGFVRQAGGKSGSLEIWHLDIVDCPAP